RLPVPDLGAVGSPGSVAGARVFCAAAAAADECGAFLASARAAGAAGSSERLGAGGSVRLAGGADRGAGAGAAAGAGAGGGAAKAAGGGICSDCVRSLRAIAAALPPATSTTIAASATQTARAPRLGGASARVFADEPRAGVSRPIRVSTSCSNATLVANETSVTGPRDADRL